MVPSPGLKGETEVAISEFLRTTNAFVLILGPIAAILVPAVLTWAKDLNSSARRVRQLEEQSRVVAFWDSWIKVVSSTKALDVWVESKTESAINTIMHEARLELAEAGRRVFAIYRNEEFREIREFKLSYKEFQSYRRGLPWYRRFFFLYKAPNQRAKLYKIAFYVDLILPFIVGSVEIPALRYFGKSVPLPPPGPWRQSFKNFGHLHPGISVVLLSALILIFLANWIGTAAVAHHRSRGYEDDENCYLIDTIERRLRDIRPAQSVDLKSGKQCVSTDV